MSGGLDVVSRDDGGKASAKYTAATQQQRSLKQPDINATRANYRRTRTLQGNPNLVIGGAEEARKMMRRMILSRVIRRHKRARWKRASNNMAQQEERQRE